VVVAERRSQFVHVPPPEAPTRAGHARGIGDGSCSGARGGRRAISPRAVRSAASRACLGASRVQTVAGAPNLRSVSRRDSCSSARPASRRSAWVARRASAQDVPERIGRPPTASLVELRSACWWTARMVACSTASRRRSLGLDLDKQVAGQDRARGRTARDRHGLGGALRRTGSLDHAGGSDCSPVPPATSAAWRPIDGAPDGVDLERRLHPAPVRIGHHAVPFENHRLRLRHRGDDGLAIAAEQLPDLGGDGVESRAGPCARCHHIEFVAMRPP